MTDQVAIWSVNCYTYDALMNNKINKKEKPQILRPTCNVSTLTDGRGGIFTWVPQDAIREFNILYFKVGATRGNHYHPEFVEYFLVIDGVGAMVYKEEEGTPNHVVHMSKGTCVRTPAGVPHAFQAVTEVTALALLTKPWDDCKVPVVHIDIL